MKPIIYLDVDDVLADWKGEFLRTIGVEAGRLGLFDWDMFDALQSFDSRFTRPYLEGLILKWGMKFWATLPLLPWARALLVLCRERADVHLVTSLMRHPQIDLLAAAGKLEWIHDTFPDLYRSAVLVQNKAILARPGVVLIDDRAHTVRKFVVAGGGGILFPSLGNVNWSYLSDPLVVVRDELDSYGIGNRNGT